MVFKQRPMELTVTFWEYPPSRHPYGCGTPPAMFLPEEVSIQVKSNSRYEINELNGDIKSKQSILFSTGR
jgi:hypothetical protein